MGGGVFERGSQAGESGSDGGGLDLSQKITPTREDASLAIAVSNPDSTKERRGKKAS